VPPYRAVSAQHAHKGEPVFYKFDIKKTENDFYNRKVKENDKEYSGTL
jgi:hypothetical protein